MKSETRKVCVFFKYIFRIYIN